MIWLPHATVAAVIESEGRFLMVEELAGGSTSVYNQPAGHLESGESLLDAVIRETREETAWQFHPEYLVGIYRWQVPPGGDTYLRFCFCGQVSGHRPEQVLDEGILAAHWLSRSQLETEPARLRSPLVMRAIDDYLAGCRHPLEILHEVE